MSARSTAAADPAHVAPVFSALGDATRLALVTRLCAGGPLSIARLTTGSDLTRQAITKHLGVLARAGLVSDARRGRERIWTLDPDHLKKARGWLDEISIQWDRALDRLKKFVEK
jgi:DNA-binding transcriptional ArsR family regulator